MTWLMELVHHGMIFVPTGYHSPLMFQLDEAMGAMEGSAWGAGTNAAGDG
jgi:NAD(P)H dehydrogenase (quinone)